MTTAAAPINKPVPFEIGGGAIELMLTVVFENLNRCRAPRLSYFEKVSERIMVFVFIVESTC